MLAIPLPKEQVNALRAFLLNLGRRFHHPRPGEASNLSLLVDQGLEPVPGFRNRIEPSMCLLQQPSRCRVQRTRGPRCHAQTVSVYTASTELHQSAIVAHRFHPPKCRTLRAASHTIGGRLLPRDGGVGYTDMLVNLDMS